MARTKSRARRRPEGDAYRENAKTEEGRNLNRQNRKRKHEAAKAATRSGTANDDEGSASQPPAKKAKNNIEGVEDDIMGVEEGNESVRPDAGGPSTIDEPSNDTSAVGAINTPLPSDLSKSYAVTTMSIITSSHIQQKVTRALDILSVYPAVPPAKPAILMLRSKAKASAKMISVAEIVKREINSLGGKWYQYNKVDQVMEEQKEKQNDTSQRGKRKGKEKGNGAEDVDDSMGGLEEGDGKESDEEAFETMKTPFERAIEGKPKVRAVPVMTIYLSRVRIETLRREYSEQTNGLELPHR